MLKDLKKESDLEVEFVKNPMAIIDCAYEAITNNIQLTDEQKDVFNRNTKLIEKIPSGELLKRMSSFIELDIFSTHFEVLNGMLIWKVIQHYSDEAVRQLRTIQ